LDGGEVTQALYDRPAAFDPSECAAILALAAAREGRPAPLTGYEGEGVDPSRRSATTMLVERDADSGWLFDRLDALFAAAGEALGFPVDPLREPVQVVRYGVGDHFQMWHTDSGHDLGERRRLSASVELSDPADYAGGLLEIAPMRMMPSRAPGQGHATIFPSRALHHVVPVTRGVRHALVAWAGLNAA
jgi:PKHD-type hydroxylase